MHKLCKIIVGCILMFGVFSSPIWSAYSPDYIKEDTGEKEETKEEAVDETEETPIEVVPKLEDCKVVENDLVCEYDDIRYFYTIAGDYTPVYRSVIKYTGEPLSLKQAEVIELLQLQVYNHKTDKLEAYDKEIHMVAKGDNRYSIEVELPDGKVRELVFSIQKEDESTNVAVVFAEREVKTIKSRKFFTIAIANVVLILFMFKFILDTLPD